MPFDNDYLYVKMMVKWLTALSNKLGRYPKHILQTKFLCAVINLALRDYAQLILGSLNLCIDTIPLH